MFDIRSITSNIGSVINNFNDNISILTIGEEIDNQFKEDYDVNFFKIGNYEDSNYKGDMSSNLFWDNMFEDFISMDRTFEIIIFKLNDELLDKLSNNQKLLDKISIICYNIIDEGVILFQKKINLNLTNSSTYDISIDSEEYKIYLTKKLVSKVDKISTNSMEKIIQSLKEIINN